MIKKNSTHIKPNCEMSKSPDIKKKTENSITNVTKSYSFYGEPYDKRSNNSSFIN